jgi:flagellar biosynthetic protein FliR
MSNGGRRRSSCSCSSAASRSSRRCCSRSPASPGILVVLGFIRSGLGHADRAAQPGPGRHRAVPDDLRHGADVRGGQEDAIDPLNADKITQAQAFERGQKPIREFMFRQTREKDLALFVKLSKIEAPKTRADVPTHVVIPAFIISELKTAFQIGFLIFLPFLVIDLVVSTTLMSMGMIMLPPSPHLRAVQDPAVRPRRRLEPDHPIARAELRMSTDTSSSSRPAVEMALKVALPLLLVGLAVGLIVSVFQAITQIQEQTLTFIPKIVATGRGARHRRAVDARPAPLLHGGAVDVDPRAHRLSVQPLVQQFGEQQVAAFFLVLARVSPLFLLAPLFSSNLLPMRVRGIVAVALAVGLSPVVMRTAPLEISAISFGELVAKELLVGLAFAFVLGALFAAISVAGTFLDTLIGFSYGAILDPVTGTQSAVISQLYGLLGVLIFIAIGGDAWVIQGLARTYDLVPLDASRRCGAHGRGDRRVRRHLRAAIQVAAPIVSRSSSPTPRSARLARRAAAQRVRRRLPAKVAVGLLLIGGLAALRRRLALGRARGVVSRPPNAPGGRDARRGEKTEKATPKKRDDARKKGQVARSADLNGAVVMLAGLLAIGFAGAGIASRLEETLRLGLLS